MSYNKPKMCRFKQVVTKKGEARNACVIDPNAITMDPDCNYNILTGKCIVNRQNVPLKKKTYRRSPLRQPIQVQPEYAQYKPTDYGIMIPKMAIPKGECRFKTSITKQGKLKNACVQDKTLSISDGRCKRSNQGRCVLVKAEKPKREYIKFTDNRELADKFRQVQMVPLTTRLRSPRRPKLERTIAMMPQYPRSIPLPPPLY
jgi:hypothetical protein